MAPMAEVCARLGMSGAETATRAKRETAGDELTGPPACQSASLLFPGFPCETIASTAVRGLRGMCLCVHSIGSKGWMGRIKRGEGLHPAREPCSSDEY